jgi:hypothetical protein
MVKYCRRYASPSDQGLEDHNTRQEQTKEHGAGCEELNSAVVLEEEEMGDGREWVGGKGGEKRGRRRWRAFKETVGFQRLS